MKKDARGAMTEKMQEQIAEAKATREGRRTDKIDNKTHGYSFCNNKQNDGAKQLTRECTNLDMVNQNTQAQLITII